MSEDLKAALKLAERADDNRLRGNLCAYLSGAYQHEGDFDTSDEWAHACRRLGETTGANFGHSSSRQQHQA